MGTKQAVQPTKLSEAIRTAMEEAGMSARDLARKVDVTYEHVRRIVRGEGEPSKYILQLICKELKLNFKEMLEVSRATKMRAKFGDLPLLLAGKKPGMEPIENVWDALTEGQRQDMVVMAQALAKNNQAR